LQFGAQAPRSFRRGSVGSAPHLPQGTHVAFDPLRAYVPAVLNQTVLNKYRITQMLLLRGRPTASLTLVPSYRTYSNSSTRAGQPWDARQAAASGYGPMQPIGVTGPSVSF